MPASSLGRSRPRPFAGAPALDGRELAKAWLVELVAVAPLERAGAVPGPRFAEDAPAVCAAVVDALGSDEGFDRLAPGGTHSPLAAGSAALAGAHDGLTAVTSLEALRAIAWAELVAALHRPSPAEVAELADRLAAVIALLVTAALAAGDPADRLRPGDRGPLAAVLRRRDVAPAPEEPHESAAAEEPSPPVSDDEPSDLAPPEDVASAPSVARLQDASAFGRRVAPWTAAIDRRLGRHRQDGLPFAVLCLEVLDADRLLRSDTDGSAARALEAAESAALAELRPADALVRERVGRYWLTAPDTDGAEARSLAHRLAAHVESVSEHRGAPLQLSIGLAACPADGTDAVVLEACAEEGLFAAQAAGVRVAGPDR